MTYRMYDLGKYVVKRVFPKTYSQIRNRRLERDKLEYRTQAALWNGQIQAVINKIIAESGVYVRNGPFSGMMYWPVAIPGYASGGLGSSLLGIYECELHEVLADAIKKQHDQVINIGCAEGYYAIGLARCLPRARVYAFDIDMRARQLCDAMAKVNGVADRIVVSGECMVDTLREIAKRRSLIVCDCEGGEIELLRSDLIPGLASCDILVELHDVLQPGISETLLPRFSATHHIEIIPTRERDPEAFPTLAFLTPDERRLAMDEHRPGPMTWAMMRSRVAAAR